MAEIEELTLSSITSLFDLKGTYIISYAWLLGMSLWVTFFGGVIAYRALPRQQFGALQHRTFPVYFRISILLSAFLLGLWTYAHPVVMANPTKFFAVDVLQAYTLLSAILFQAGNHFVIGPYTSSLMFQRHKLEKSEGKAYTDAGISDEMKALSKKFAQAHGFSSVFNLDALIALIFHGLWIAKHGLGRL